MTYYSGGNRGELSEVKLIAAISDTHVGDGLDDLPKYLLDLLDQRKPDLILHAGDIIRGKVLQQLKEVADTLAVKGDNDLIDLPLQICFKINGQTIALTHGDRQWWKEYPSICVNRLLARIGARYRWWNGYANNLCKQFASDEPDCIIFGHLHYALRKKLNKTLLINPGAVYLNGRGTQQGISPSFAFIKFEPRSIQVEIVKLSLDLCLVPNRFTRAPRYLSHELESLI